MIVSLGKAFADDTTKRYSIRVLLQWAGQTPQQNLKIPLIPGFNGIEDDVDLQTAIQSLAHFDIKSVFGVVSWQADTLVPPQTSGPLAVYFPDSQFCSMLTNNAQVGSATIFGTGLSYTFSSFSSPLITAGTKVQIYKFADSNNTMNGTGMLFFNSFELGNHFASGL